MTSLELGGLAALVLLALGLAASAQRSVRRRRYLHMLRMLGFRPYSGDPERLVELLATAQIPPRVGRAEPLAAAAPLRLSRSEGSVHHIQVVQGGGRAAREWPAFLVERPGRGPVAPVAVDLCPAGWGRLAGVLGRLGVAPRPAAAERLRVPPKLAEQGVARAVSPAGQELAKVLDAQDLQRLARARELGFARVQVAKGGVVLRLRDHRGDPHAQVDYARKWLA